MAEIGIYIEFPKNMHAFLFQETNVASNLAATFSNMKANLSLMA